MDQNAVEYFYKGKKMVEKERKGKNKQQKKQTLTQSSLLLVTLRHIFLPYVTAGKGVNEECFCLGRKPL